MPGDFWNRICCNKVVKGVDGKLSSSSSSSSSFFSQHTPSRDAISLHPAFLQLRLTLRLDACFDQVSPDQKARLSDFALGAVFPMQSPHD